MAISCILVGALARRRAPPATGWRRRRARRARRRRRRRRGRGCRPRPSGRSQQQVETRTWRSYTGGGRVGADDPGQVDASVRVRRPEARPRLRAAPVGCCRYVGTSGHGPLRPDGAGWGGERAAGRGGPAARAADRGAAVRAAAARPPRARAPGRHAPWPQWVDPSCGRRWRRPGIAAPWTHQVEAAELAHAGRHVVVATGTASGKTLGYLLPALTALARGDRGAERARRHGALPLPHQGARARPAGAARRGSRCRGCGPRPTTATPRPTSGAGSATTRNLVLTNPDLLHHSLLPGHERWAPFLRALRYVVVDECHVYRGRLRLARRRACCAGCGGSRRATAPRPTFVLASATVADPERARVAACSACRSTAVTRRRVAARRR